MVFEGVFIIWLVKNLILMVKDWLYFVYIVFNLGVVWLRDGMMLFLCWVEDFRGILYLNVVWFWNGVDGWEIDVILILFFDFDKCFEEFWGLEDFWIVYMVEIDLYYIIYMVYICSGLGVVIVIINDFVMFEYGGLIM